MENKKCMKTSIGGQAVLEGVMMKGPDYIATSVRKKSGEIVVDKQPVNAVIKKNKLAKLPIIRGVINFVQSMVLGIKTLMLSADLYDLDEDETTYEPSKFDLWLEKVFKNKDAVIYTSVVIALFLSVALFIFLPAVVTKFVAQFVPYDFVKSIIEGVMRMVIFVAYVLLVSQTKEIKRVFQYHGAEHKSIACYEHGEELTVENVRKYSRFHPRCGTSFLIEVMIIGIIVFSFVTWSNLALRIVIKLALLPLVAGLAYEFIKFAGRCDNKLMRVLSAPGLWLQRITTKEPDDEQIEVAIRSLTEVIPENEEDAKW